MEVWECEWMGGLSPRNQNLQIEQNMLAEFVYIQLGGDVGDQRKFCDPGSLRVGTEGLDNIREQWKHHTTRYKAI